MAGPETSGSRPEIESQTPFVDGLIQTATAMYRLQESVERDGRQAPYLSMDAIGDTLKKLDLQPYEIFGRLTQETTITPEELGNDLSLGANNNWDDFFVDASQLMLGWEMVSRDPSIKEEDNRRDLSFLNKE